MVALEVSNTFNLQFEVKLEVKRGNGESNPGGERLSNTFKLQFEVKLELKRGNGSLVLFPLLAFNLQFEVKLEVKRGTPPWMAYSFWRLTSSLRSNWRLNFNSSISYPS